MSVDRFTNRKHMSQINVVPYIDVMLVLLLIFMITTPLMQQGIEIQLPTATTAPIKEEFTEPVVVEVTRDGLYRVVQQGTINKPVKDEELAGTVRSLLENAVSEKVYIRGDAAVNYGRVISAMSLLKKAGVDDIGLFTQPPIKEK